MRKLPRRRSLPVSEPSTAGRFRWHLVLQKEEVEAVEWFALEETYAECQKSREKFCVPSGGLEIVREFMTEKRG